MGKLKWLSHHSFLSSRTLGTTNAMFSIGGLCGKRKLLIWEGVSSPMTKEVFLSECERMHFTWIRSFSLHNNPVRLLLISLFLQIRKLRHHELRCLVRDPIVTMTVSESMLVSPQYWFATRNLSRQEKREWTSRGPFKPEAIHEFAGRGKIWGALLKNFLISFGKKIFNMCVSIKLAKIKKLKNPFRKSVEKALRHCWWEYG